MSSAYQVIFKREALKYLSKQDAFIQKRIYHGIKGLLVVPPEGDIKKMRGSQDLYRLRIGNYRVLFKINHVRKVVYIEAVGIRGSIYG